MPKKQTTSNPNPIHDNNPEQDPETDTNPQSQKVVEIYLDTLKEYKKKINKEKLIDFMQVGDFFEIS